MNTSNAGGLIVNAHGKPARQADETCPGCQKPCPRGDARARCASGGFGELHDVCRRCGYDFVDEYTLTGEGS